MFPPQLPNSLFSVYSWFLIEFGPSLFTLCGINEFMSLVLSSLHCTLTISSRQFTHSVFISTNEIREFCSAIVVQISLSLVKGEVACL
jgi:hypothetical protein